MSPKLHRFLANLAEQVANLSRLTPRVVRVRVVEITAGAASDGSDLCVVDWRGEEVPAAYLAGYTPVVDHSVAALYQDGQLLILGRPIGTP